MALNEATRIQCNFTAWCMEMCHDTSPPQVLVGMYVNVGCSCRELCERAYVYVYIYIYIYICTYSIQLHLFVHVVFRAFIRATKAFFEMHLWLMSDSPEARDTLIFINVDNSSLIMYLIMF